MTNRVLVVVTILILILLALSAELTLLIINSPAFSSVEPQSLTAAVPTIAAATQTVVLPEETDTETTAAPEDTAQPVTETQAVTTEESFSPTPRQPAQEPTAAVTESPAVSSTVPCDVSLPFTASLILEDTGTHEAPFGAEMIRLIRYNADQTITVIPLSAYLAVSAPHLKEQYGIQDSTLGNVYQAVYQRTGGADSRHNNAASATNLVIGEVFEIAPDFYISVNKTFLISLVQFTGPLELANPAGFSTKANQFPAGNISITEDNIWDFMVYSGGTDTEPARMARQDLVLQAAFAAMRAHIAPADLSAWIDEQSDLFTTDMETAMLQNTFCVLAYVDSIEYRQMPEDALNIRNNDIRITDPEQFSELFR